MLNTKQRTTSDATFRSARNVVARLKVWLTKDDEEATMSPPSNLRQVMARMRRSVTAAAVFSGAINVLALSGSLFMLQVYDRVLPSHSLPTLGALVILIVVLYILSTVMEMIRSRLFARAGRYVDYCLRDSVFDLNTRSGLPGQRRQTSAPFSDLAQLRNFLSSGAPSAIFDLPWMPLYGVMLFLLHPWIGVMGLAGVALLSLFTWLTDKATSPHQQSATRLTLEANEIADASRRAAETVVPQGMTEPMRFHWASKNDEAGEAILKNSDIVGFYGGASRFLRMSLQSLVLALGAYLVIKGEASGGVMIAASILLGRALAPVEMAIGQWRNFVATRQAYQRINEALASPDKATRATQLPPPQKTLQVEGLTVTAPGNEEAVLLSGIGFELDAGDALGVIGPSGSGKSTLARALMDVVICSAGTIRLDGATLNQWSDAERGAFTGYLPQDVSLFSGTVGQNIARFQPVAVSEDILEAAGKAGVDKLIRGLPEGFDTDIGIGGGRLSAGERQRVALARALYKNPFLVVLDEPNSALDAEGEAALAASIAGVRERGGIVIIFSHRPAVLQSVNKMLVIAGGAQKAFGPRDEVVRRLFNKAQGQAGTGLTAVTRPSFNRGGGV